MVLILLVTLFWWGKKKFENFESEQGENTEASLESCMHVRRQLILEDVLLREKVMKKRRFYSWKSHQSNTKKNFCLFTKYKQAKLLGQKKFWWGSNGVGKQQEHLHHLVWPAAGPLATYWQSRIQFNWSYYSGDPGCLSWGYMLHLPISKKYRIRFNEKPFWEETFPLFFFKEMHKTRWMLCYWTIRY